jgi:hypothetical protein
MCTHICCYWAHQYFLSGIRIKKGHCACFGGCKHNLLTCDQRGCCKRAAAFLSQNAASQPARGRIPSLLRCVRAHGSVTGVLGAQTAQNHGKPPLWKKCKKLFWGPFFPFWGGLDPFRSPKFFFLMTSFCKDTTALVLSFSTSYQTCVSDH